MMLTAGLLVTATLLLGVPGIVASVVFGLRVRNDVLVATVTANSVLWTTAVIALAPDSGDLAVLAFVFVLITAATAALRLALALRHARIRWTDTAALRGDLARLALPIGLASVLIFAYGRIDQILVFELAGARDAGLYGAAYRVLTQGALIPVALITTLFPIMTAARADVERLKRAAQGAFDYLAMLALPAIAFALVEAEPFMRGLFGAEFSGSAPALRILMLALVPIYLSYLVAALVFVLDEQWRFVRYTAIGLALNVVLNLVLVPELGFIAAAWITVLTEGLVVALGLSLVLRRLALRIRLARLARCAASAVTLGAAVWVLKLAGTPLVAEIVAAALLYPVLLLATRALGPQDLATFRRRPDPPA
jgi:O-antigen/teichoic acid export membrane protein